MATKLTTQLAEFARTAQPSGLVSDVLRLSMLDWLSVAMAGQDQPVARSVLSLAREEAGKPEAFLFGADQMAPARMAALVNGTIGHALDYDDTHFAHIG
ncbi:MAG: MmgE/PrpD family protein, partial [Paracoccaceae bacterium]|nr:MmgE/PrpD family protein [Paracoccaceae bacterium]